MVDSISTRRDYPTLPVDGLVTHHPLAENGDTVRTQTNVIIITIVGTCCWVTVVVNIRVFFLIDVPLGIFLSNSFVYHFKCHRFINTIDHLFGKLGYSALSEIARGFDKVFVVRFPWTPVKIDAAPK